MLSIRRCVFLTTIFLFAAFISSPAQVVISQVYGGGGNSGATIKNDFIEVFNRGTAAVTISNWSVQYAATTGTSWQVTSFSTTLQPGQHFLIQEAAGAGGTVLLVPDATGGINMSGTVGKVALVNNTTALTGACPSGGGIQDFVGYGTGTNCSETAVTPSLSNTTAALRLNNGCTDTNNNSADFSVGAPNPRNSTATLTPCGLGFTNSSPLADATVGTSYTVTFNVSGGTSPYTFSKISGNFPDGLLLSGATLSGIPTTTSGSPFTFTMQVTDSAVPAVTAQKDFQITVKPSSTPPTGAGSATPGSLQPGNNTVLKVTVTPGANPASTGITVVGDLSSIGGSASQTFFDDGATGGDVTAGDNVFTFTASVPNGTSPGSKPLPITVSDAQSRSSNSSIALTVQPPPPPTTVKISQIYGGGGNSGSTYTNDFIEIFNQASTPIDLTGWSVQYTSAAATNAWQVTNICPSAPCILQPGHYYLVQESAGTGGTTAPPTADVVGTIPMGAGSGNVVLVANTTALANGCHPGGAIVDTIGYGGGACAETTLASSAATLTNTTAAVRRGNGCVDTDNNSADFVAVGPIPRNSASPANFCANDPGQPSGLGIATPDSVDPASNTLLTVKVTPATTPASTNISVVADLTNFGGSATQQFYDDGTHGDQVAGDNTFSYEATLGAAISTGAKSSVATITDAQSRTATAPITLTVQSPTCGVERWSVKVGTDPDANQVNLDNIVRGNILDLGLLSPPPDPPGPPDNMRVDPTEKTVFVVNAMMTFYKKETDVDYHIVLSDPSGNTLIAEIPSPACILLNGSPRVLGPSPFAAGIAAARANFDSHLTAQTFFQNASVPVQIKGVGFFDFIHGQTGVAPNGIELHPVLEINFTTPTTTTLVSGVNPSNYGQAVSFTATVSNGGVSVPSGHVSLFDGGTLVTTVSLDPTGQGTFSISSLSVGPHSVYVTYEGDSASAESKSNTVARVVNPADQAINFATLGSKTYGDAPFTVSATGGPSGTPVTFVASGNCTSGGANGSTITITGAGSCTVTASQAGNTSYNAAPDVARSFTINRANATVSVNGYTGVYDGNAHGATGSATGVNSEDLVSLVDLGATFTNYPGGTANWSFAGNSNYNSASGSVSIVINRATPAFSNLSSPVITLGATPTTLGGNISLGSLVPTGGVSITLHGVTQNAGIGTGGSFSSGFATGALPAVNPPYDIAYSYAGDNNFNPASGSSTLTVGYAVVPLFDQTKAAQSGSTIPIRLALANVSGGNVSLSAIVVTAVKLVQASSNATFDILDSGNANPEGNFRFDGSAYIFNLSTKGLPTGPYQLVFTVSGDPTSHSVNFQEK